MRVEFGEYVLVADDFGKVAGPNLAESPQLSGRVHGTAREEGGNRGELSAIGVVSGASLLLAPLLFFLEALGGIHDARCDAAECAPDHGARPERSSGVFAGECHQGVAASLAARHGVGKTEDVCDRVAGNGVTEAQWPG